MHKLRAKFNPHDATRPAATAKVYPEPILVNIPVNNISQEIVVPQSVIDVHLLVVDRQGASANTSLVFLGWMSTEFPREDFQNLLADPSTFCECREGEVIGIYLTETWNTQREP